MAGHDSYIASGKNPSVQSSSVEVQTSQAMWNEYEDEMAELYERLINEGIPVPLDENGDPIFTPEFISTLPEKYVSRPGSGNSGQSRPEVVSGGGSTNPSKVYNQYGQNAEPNQSGGQSYGANNLVGFPGFGGQMGSNGVQMNPNGIPFQGIAHPYGQSNQYGSGMGTNGMQAESFGMANGQNGFQMGFNGMQMTPNGIQSVGPSGYSDPGAMMGAGNYPAASGNMQPYGQGGNGITGAYGGGGSEDAYGQQLIQFPEGGRSDPMKGVGNYTGANGNMQPSRQGGNGTTGAGAYGQQFSPFSDGGKSDPYFLTHAVPGTFTAPDGTLVRKLKDGRFVYADRPHKLIEDQDFAKWYGFCPHGIVKGIYCSACEVAGYQPPLSLANTNGTDPIVHNVTHFNMKDEKGLDNAINHAVNELERGGWKLLDGAKDAATQSWTINALPLKTREDVALYNYYLLCLEGKFVYPDTLTPPQLLNLVMLLITDNNQANMSYTPSSRSRSTRLADKKSHGGDAADIFRVGMVKDTPKFHNFPECFVKDGTCGKAPRRLKPDELRFLTGAVDYAKSDKENNRTEPLGELKKTDDDNEEDDGDSVEEADTSKLPTDLRSTLKSRSRSTVDQSRPTTVDQSRPMTATSTQPTAEDIAIQQTLKDMNKFKLPPVKNQDWDLNKALDGTRPVTRQEVAIHTDTGDVLLIRNQVVLNVLSVVVNNINDHYETVQPLLKMKGSDISHWFDSITGSPRTKVDAKTGKKVLYFPDGLYYGLGPIKRFLESEQHGDFLQNRSNLAINSISTHKNPLGDSKSLEFEADEDYRSYITDNFEYNITSGFPLIARPDIDLHITNRGDLLSPKEDLKGLDEDVEIELGIEDPTKSINEQDDKDNNVSQNPELVFIKERNSISPRSSVSTSSSTEQLKVVEALPAIKESPNKSESSHSSGRSSPNDHNNSPTKDISLEDFNVESPKIVTSNENSSVDSNSPKVYASVLSFSADALESEIGNISEFQLEDNNNQSEFRGQDEVEFDSRSKFETGIENDPQFHAASVNETKIPPVEFIAVSSSIMTVDVPLSVLYNTSNVSIQGSSHSRLSDISSTFSRALSYRTTVASTAIGHSETSSIANTADIVFEEAWWMEPKYIAGYVPADTVNIRIVNSLSYKEKTLTVSKEYTINDVMRCYLPFNKNAMNYTWKDVFENVLDVHKTLVENGLIDENAEDTKINHIPAIVLYFRDGFEDETPLPLNPKERQKLQIKDHFYRNY